jgi:hypothetical protein
VFRCQSFIELKQLNADALIEIVQNKTLEARKKVLNKTTASSVTYLKNLARQLQKPVNNYLIPILFFLEAFES